VSAGSSRPATGAESSDPARWRAGEAGQRTQGFRAALGIDHGQHEVSAITLASTSPAAAEPRGADRRRSSRNDQRRRRAEGAGALLADARCAERDAAAASQGIQGVSPGWRGELVEEQVARRVQVVGVEPPPCRTFHYAGHRGAVWSQGRRLMAGLGQAPLRVCGCIASSIEPGVQNPSLAVVDRGGGVGFRAPTGSRRACR